MSWRQYRTIEPQELLLFAVDTAAGGGDYTACQVVSKTKIDVPMVFHSKVTTGDFIPQLVRTMDAVFDHTGIKPHVAVERQFGGHILMDRIAGLNYAGKYECFAMPRVGNVTAQDPLRLGWDTNSATRPIMLADLQDAVNRQLLGIYDRQTINEMLSFIVAQTSTSWKAQAESGAHDDLVMALAIGWQMYKICGAPQEARSDYSSFENFHQPKTVDGRGHIII